MESQNKDSASRLLRAQTHVVNHIFSFINSMTLKSAVDLNIPDIIHKHGKPMPLSLLISSLQIHPSKSEKIHRLMRLLTHSGFFSLQKLLDDDGEEIEQQGYVLTDASTLLIKDNPLNLTPVLHPLSDPIVTKSWTQIANWFQNDDHPTAFHMANGKTVWEYAEVDPEFNHFLNDAMASDTKLVSSVIIDKCKDVFKGLESLVDVGGGIGTMAKVIAKEFQEIQCVVFDLPHVVGGLQDSGNLKFVGGNMFEGIPSSYGILLKWILHDWNDEECVQILKKCKEAIANKGRDGKVIIIDMIMENGDKGDKDYETVETQLFYDMWMMVLGTGKERNEREWANLFSYASFSNYKITPVLGIRSLIEVFP